MRWAGSIPACPLRNSSNAVTSTPVPRQRAMRRISPSASVLACPGQHRPAGERHGLLLGALVTLVRRMQYGLESVYTGVGGIAVCCRTARDDGCQGQVKVTWTLGNHAPEE